MGRPRNEDILDYFSERMREDILDYFSEGMREDILELILSCTNYIGLFGTCE